MSTLLLRLSAPMQSWGSDARYDTVRTRREPTKSGVLGMIAAAMGCDRTDFPMWLNVLHFGVRVDREGSLLRDFHMAHTAQGTAYVTYRYYLCDAVFLVGLEGEDSLLHEITQALIHPYFPLYLGRRSCPPEGKMVLGIRSLPLMKALTQEPPIAENNDKASVLRLVLDAEPGEPGAGIQRDVPLSLDTQRRQYGFRGVKEYAMHIREEREHDPMAELEG